MRARMSGFEAALSSGKNHGPSHSGPDLPALGGELAQVPEVLDKISKLKDAPDVLKRMADEARQALERRKELT